MTTEQINADLLESCKELRALMLAALRVFKCHEGAREDFELEINRIGLRDFLGARSDGAILEAERP